MPNKLPPRNKIVFAGKNFAIVTKIYISENSDDLLMFSTLDERKRENIIHILSDRFRQANFYNSLTPFKA